jgi:hypothetical protein
MKKRLNKKGKVLVTSLTFMLSVVIYVLMAILGAKGQTNIFYQVVLVCGWIWMLFGQISVYMMVWE